ncbi:MAG: branched-chain amino acid ABC transporter permease [Alphaproteobacteria bacterium]|jgi:branched-chain amino acid transport system permease protein|nr:branched-chain amino acid ABC transporter permease [Alphaproteobacteria bacterium]
MMRYLAALAVLVGFAIMPEVIGEYYVEIMILFMINLILASSFRLITTCGDWSLSHVVFMGVGAYATALLAKFLGWPFWGTVLLGGMASAVIGLAVVFPLLRTKGFGFFIGSFALGEFVRLIWVKFHFPFGGPRGMIGIPSIELSDIDFYEAIPYYYLVLLFTIACLAILYRIDLSRTGKVLKAIYADEDLSRCIGINVARYRAMAFSVSAFFAGIAGVLLAHRLGAIDPKNFDVNTMVYLVIWVVVGGVGSFWGPLIGVAVMMLVGEAARPLAEWRPLLFGGILIVFLTLLPGGLDSLMSKVREMLDKRTADGTEKI